MNIFEQATRQKLRFQTVRGTADVETLWQMPLQSPDDYSLDAVGTALVKVIKDFGEDSLLKKHTMTATAKANELRLEVVKHIIDVKLAEAIEREQQAAKSQQLAVLETAMANRKTETLNSLTVEEPQERIDKLKAS